jgi:RHH-type proline utilization regulon transcriptional repressor/proline dehydrogenase/delta 1-pyrroline-5-carboxylate dehydrogenase
MLGEAALTEADAGRYHVSYARAISAIAKAANSENIAENPGISIKLSALHPRYEMLQRDRVLEELTPRVMSLVTLAKSAGIGLNTDAEEAARLDLSLDVIESVLSNPTLAGWDGFGVVVQAYSKRASTIIDWLYAQAKALDRRIMVRLVKGAYWDTEIKLAQVEGLPGFPVFTRKAATDTNYLACAKKLFSYNDRIYPQFATHNAHTTAAVLEMAPEGARYEFQRLHGMGEALHTNILKAHGTRCRIYAPVGAHRDLLAYLVRRLLENGANSSFVNQIVDENVPADVVAADPIALLDAPHNSRVKSPADLFAPERVNSAGYDLSNPDALGAILESRDDVPSSWAKTGSGLHDVTNPATGAIVGQVRFADAAEARAEMDRLHTWTASVTQRAAILNKAADLFEVNAPELFSLLAQEAGKTLNDCIGELREAVDFLRYYAATAPASKAAPLGTVVCISPWNFPLAIFTGQISAALAQGNAVLAKPAEATCLIAERAVALLHEAGVPQDALALLCGEGNVLGPVLCAHPKTSLVAFTGSTTTAQSINRELAQRQPHQTPFVAETGGINAMIVDSTALLEQAVADIMTSAFQSAGQRCSALRVLYVQSDIVAPLKEMLFGAMETQVLGDPLLASVDIGPVIDVAAKTKIDAYIERAAADGRLMKQIDAPGPLLARR